MAGREVSRPHDHDGDGAACGLGWHLARKPGTPVDHSAVGPNTAIDGLGAIERARRPAGIARHELFPGFERRALDGENGAGIETALDERHILEITAGVASGLEPEALHFRRDVRGGFQIVFAAGQPAHHGIV